MMYDELVRQMRACCNGEPCEEANCCFNPKSDLDCIEQLLTKAAYAIEELSEQLENETEYATALNSYVPKWIPMTERLPNIGTYIVAGKMKYSFEENYEHFVDVASYGFWDDKKEESWLTFNDWYEGQQEYEITHYMPLPEPPKEE